MRRASPPLLALALFACGPVTSSSDAGSSSAADPTTTADPGSSTTADPSTTAATPTTGAPASSTGEPTTAADSLGFTRTPDLGCQQIGCMNCDTFAQNCAEGEKCTAWGPGGSGWNASKCVPVTGDGVAGEPCTVVDNATSGLDDCALGHMCWGLGDDLQGTCVALCGGDELAPECAEGTTCLYSGVLNLCLQTCDPLVKDCPATDVCVPINNIFVCDVDTSGAGGQLNTACDSATTCDPGLFCVDPQNASSACEDPAADCCSPFCEFPGGACPNPDQQCLQYYDPASGVPPGGEHIGVCAVPL